MSEAAVLDAPVTPSESEPTEPEVVWQSDPHLSPKAEPAATPPASEASAPAVEPPSGSEGQASKPPADVPTDWKAKLEAGDPDFLQEFQNHPKVKGFIAGQADFLQKQQTAQAAKAQLIAEAKANPDLLQSQVTLAQEDQLSKIEQETSKANETFALAQQGVSAFVQSLPETARAEIGKLAPEGKPYGKPGDLASGFTEYMGDVVKGVLTANASDLKTQVTELQATIKSLEAQLSGADRSPDLGSASLGGVAPGGLTLEKYAKMSPQELTKLASTPAGRAQIDAL